MSYVKHLTLVIPMYNEAKIIKNTAEILSSYMEKAVHQELLKSYEIIFSNDGSIDGCDEIVKNLNLPNVRVVGYDVNHGKGCAVRTAVLDAVSNDSSPEHIIMFTDADLAYGTDIISTFVSAAADHPSYGIFIGSRNLSADGYDGYTAIRKLTSKAYIWFLRIIGGFKLSDSQCGCKAYRADSAQLIFNRCQIDGFAFDFETLLYSKKFGISVKEIPVKIINHNQSTVNIKRDVFLMLRDLIKMRVRIFKEKI